MALLRLTFTGADGATNLDDLASIASRHKRFVEWGILLPPGGKSRFPNLAWVQEIVGMARWEGIALSGHLCPPWTGRFLSGSATIADLVGDCFQRIQVNTHGEPYYPHPGIKGAMEGDSEREYILQIDNANPWQRLGPNIKGLYDLSHGGGVVPDSWPKPSHSWVGYAGGLGPHNLAREIPKILEAARGADIWIDLETHVRTNGEFDLDKVRRCIAIAEPFLGASPSPQSGPKEPSNG